jgi:AcrR family transcriptional regulator
MPPGGAPRRGRDGARTRASIEREALRLFAAKGVDGTSIKDIAGAVGVADAALYRHFASKEDMANAIFARHYGELAAAIHAIAATALPFSAKARALVDLFCTLFDEEPDVFAFLLLNQHAHLRFVPKEAERNAVEALRGMMASAHEAGEIAEPDADLAAAMALGAVVQPAVYTLYGRLSRPLGARADAMAAAALAVVGAKA